MYFVCILQDDLRPFLYGTPIKALSVRTEQDRWDPELLSLVPCILPPNHKGDNLLHGHGTLRGNLNTPT